MYDRADRRRRIWAIFASSSGNLVEWFDFYAYAFTALYFAVARQITEAFPWDEASRHLIRDRDLIYGSVVRCQLRAMGIRDRPTALASPWQNGFAEGLIGSIRRECLDHIIVLGEVRLRQILQSYARY